MKLITVINNGSACISLEGRLDTSSAPQLEAEIKNSVGDAAELVLDMKGLDYLSSAGLRVLLAAQKSMARRGTMRIRNVNETIMEVFQITGFIDILHIDKTDI